MTPQDFARKHQSLVWSRSDATPGMILRAALLQPRFHTVLDACSAFGLGEVKRQWQDLRREQSPEVERAAPIVERMLTNIQAGLQHAAA